MKTKILSLVGAVTLSGFISSFTAMAQSEGSLDRIEKERRDLEERRRAEQTVNELLASQNSLQKNVDQLQRKKADLSRDLNYYRIKLDRALAELDRANKMQPADKEILDNAQKDVNYYQSRFKVVEGEVAAAEASLQDAIKAYRDALINPAKTKLVLPGQTLQLFVLEDESYNGLYQVRSGGYVILPRVGRVSVVGKDLNDAEKAIKAELEKSQLKNATVMLEASSGAIGPEESDIIYLAGEFKTTGPLRTPAGVQPTLVTTILRSGGLTSSADLTRVKVLRLETGKALVEEVNVQAILDGVGLQSDLALAAGDIVVVPAFAPVVYVTGNVKAAGVIQLSPDEDLTAYAAILRCGGFSRFAKLSGVYVLRDRGNGEKARIPVNIKDLQRGKRADVILQGKDIIVVPERFFSF